MRDAYVLAIDAYVVAAGFAQLACSKQWQWGFAKVASELPETAPLLGLVVEVVLGSVD